jgi:hypothetical protein
MKQKKLQARMVEKVDVALYIADEQQAAVIFPNKEGAIDMNVLLSEMIQLSLNGATTSSTITGSTRLF